MKVVGDKCKSDSHRQTEKASLSLEILLCTELQLPDKSFFPILPLMPVYITNLSTYAFRSTKEISSINPSIMAPLPGEVLPVNP